VGRDGGQALADLRREPFRTIRHGIHEMDRGEMAEGNARVCARRVREGGERAMTGSTSRNTAFHPSVI